MFNINVNTTINNNIICDDIVDNFANTEAGKWIDITTKGIPM